MRLRNADPTRNEAHREEETGLNVATAFDQGDDFLANIVKADVGGPYSVKDAAHPHDRIEERTNLHRNNIEPIQKAVDYLGLEPGSYHVPLRGKNGDILGYAQFKSVKNRKGPVLATVLGPNMTPGGDNLETRFFNKIANLRIPDEALAWNGSHSFPNKQETTPYSIDRAFNQVSIPLSDSPVGGKK